MKKCILSAISGFTTMLVAHTVSAETDLLRDLCCYPASDTQWYVQATGGLTITPDIEFGHFADGFQGYKLDLKNGFDFSMAIGRVIDCWHMQLETRYQHNEIRNLKASGQEFVSSSTRQTLSGELKTWSVMFNLLHDFKVCEDWSLFLGGGLGLAHLRYERNFLVLLPIGTKFASTDHGWTFAWQLMTGVTWDLTDHLTVLAMYRFFANGKGAVEDKEFGDDPSKMRHMPFSNNIELGARLKF